MSNLFRNMSNNTQPALLFVWPLACGLVALSVILMIEDYLTSRAGYLMIPTQKVNFWAVTFAVSFLPQAGQIVLFWIFGRNTRRGWALVLAATFFLVDLGTDAWFKSGGQLSLIPISVVESLFIFTLGSEVLFTITTGFIFESFGDFIVVFSGIIRTGMDGLRDAMKTLGFGEEEYRQDNRKMQ